MKKIILIFLIFFLYTEDVFPSNKILSTDEAVVALLGSPDETEIRIQKITENLYLFFGLGGNIAVSIGDDGVLIVDDQIPSLIPKIKDAIKEIGGGDLVYTINTHWHFDHAEGNLALDPKITKIISMFILINISYV